MAESAKKKRGPRRVPECEGKSDGKGKTLKELNELKELRIDSGMKQSEIAAQIGVSKYTVSSWERGVSIPSWSHLSALARILDTSVANLARIIGMDGDNSEIDLHLQGQDMHMAAKGKISIVSEILYLFSLLDEQGKETVRVVLEMSGKGADRNENG